MAETNETKADQTEAVNTSISSSSTLKESSSEPKKRNGPPKPSQITVEVDSEEERAKQPPRLRGILAGLNPNAVLTQPTTQQSIEISSDEDSDMDENDAASRKRSRSTTQLPNHGTRASRYGRAAVNYDMKYHPSYDNALRPKRTAKRQSGSRSLSASVKPDVDSETEDESEPSLAKDSESSDDEGASEDDEVPSATQRAPDPKATRHSARAEANKTVNYSKKFHPQDFALPGFQHKAKHLPQAEPDDVVPKARPSKKRRSSVQGDVQESAIEITSGTTSSLSPIRPHKKLKSHRSSSPAAQRARVKSRKKAQKSTKPPKKHVSGSDEALGMMDDFINDRLQLETAAVDGAQDSDDEDPVGDLERAARRSSMKPTQEIGAALADEFMKTNQDSASATQSFEREDEGYTVADDPPCDFARKAALQSRVHRSVDDFGGEQLLVKTEDRGTQTTPDKVNIAMTPDSSGQIMLVRPYLTGYEPTMLDLSTVGFYARMKTQMLPEPCTQPRNPLAEIDKGFSSNSTAPSSPAEKTREQVLASSKACAKDTMSHDKTGDNEAASDWSTTTGDDEQPVPPGTEFVAQQALDVATVEYGSHFEDHMAMTEGAAARGDPDDTAEQHESQESPNYTLSGTPRVPSTSSLPPTDPKSAAVKFERHPVSSSQPASFEPVAEDDLIESVPRFSSLNVCRPTAPNMH